MTSPLDPKPRYSINDMVRLGLDASKVGVVRGIEPAGEARFQYLVFFTAQDRRYVAEQDLLPITDETYLLSDFQHRFTLDDLRREILLAKLATPYGETLYSLRASRLEFHVYQFKPVLKFLRSSDQRLLIADEVGLGKTIEAGIILTELNARIPLQRALVVAPSALGPKWRDEMRSRFDEDFVVLDANSLRHFIQRYRQIGDAARLRGIASLELLRRAEFVEALADSQLQLDLVVIDEAHHCRNPETRSHELATTLADIADAMLLLTATPLQLGTQDLFSLLHILAPGEFSELAAFEDQIAPNRYVNAASKMVSAGRMHEASQQLAQLGTAAFGNTFARNPFYAEATAILASGTIDTDALIRCQRALVELNTLSHVFTRTKKRQVLINAPIREAYTIRFTFSAEEQAFYDALVTFIREQFRTAGSSWASAFALVTRERQAASCLRAFQQTFLDRLLEPFPDPEDLEAVDDAFQEGSLSDYRFPPDVIQAAKALRLASRGLPGLDTKFELFLRTVRDVLREDSSAKIVVFAFFKDTLRYLGSKLSQQGLTPAIIDGSIPLFQRLSIIDAFRSDPNVAVLLSSEVGSEGIDLQFSHILINYDLPWNPMKVEQRIGRVDRFGQTHPKVVIYNPVAEGTIDDRIYARLYDRIHIFEESIGDLDAILGDEMRDLTRALYSRTLTPAQEDHLAEQTARNILRHKKELEEFETVKMEFMGQDALFEADVNNALLTGRYVSPKETESLLKTYVGVRSPKGRLTQNQGEDSWFLTLDEVLVSDLRPFTMRIGTLDTSRPLLAQRVRPGSQIPLTFSDSMAYERKLLEFITVRHPFALAATSFWRQQDRGDYPVLIARVHHPEVAPGRHFVFIFSLQIESLRRQEQIISVVVTPPAFTIDPDLSSVFLRIIQEGLSRGTASPDSLAASEFAKARQAAIGYMTTRRDKTEEDQLRLNSSLVDMRLSSLEQTLSVKRRRVEKSLQQASEPRIQRMRTAQLENMQIKSQSDRQALESRRPVTVTFALSLAGLIFFEPPN